MSVHDEHDEEDDKQVVRVPARENQEEEGAWLRFEIEQNTCVSEQSDCVPEQNKNNLYACQNRTEGSFICKDRQEMKHQEGM